MYQAFETADRPITLGLGSAAIWTRFWTAVGDVGYGARSDLGSNAARRERRGEVVEHIQTILRRRSRDAWLAIFAQARVPAGPINQVDEVAHDPALQARGLFFAATDARGRMVPQLGLGGQIDGRSSAPRSLPPRLGEHTHDVLSERGDQRLRMVGGAAQGP